MCDYSLHSVASRPAKVGDKLKTTQFVNSITRGLADLDQPNVAVCLLPGTEVAFDREVEFEGGLGFFLCNWSRSGKLTERTARFRQIDTDKPHVHHDALEFPNGEVVLLTRLVAGQTATVLQLPVRPEEIAPRVSQHSGLRDAQKREDEAAGDHLLHSEQ
jgi:hypothetical protein